MLLVYCKLNCQSIFAGISVKFNAPIVPEVDSRFTGMYLVSRIHICGESR